MSKCRFCSEELESGSECRVCHANYMVVIGAKKMKPETVQDILLRLKKREKIFSMVVGDVPTKTIVLSVKEDL